ncbi:MAG TPA: DUF2748 family protein [Candidatus Megaira endosymbiont of Nemacystus decipiens]|nr:DUF2748 family protein [Candidatus Megaera endosymbiont of Nemacystus decipiens]
MSSVYHILNKIPAIYEDEIAFEYEELSKELLSSGRLRIDTNYYSNFVRFSDNKYKINLTFSYKELNDANLIQATKKIIKNTYGFFGEDITKSQIDNIIDLLRKKAKRLLLPDENLSIKLARILVQSSHPIVIRWLLLDRVEIFITYSHNIGDTMNVANWKRNGKNSGMQSTDGTNAIIYVSCGGDPFLENSKEYPQYGNGWAALARLQIIAAQEIGHYADILRDNMGGQITRHSANFSCTEAKANVAKARIDDINRSHNLLKDLKKNGLAKLIDIETKVKFYDQNKILSIKTLLLKLQAFFQKRKLLNYCLNQGLVCFKIFYRREKYMGLMIEEMVNDMLSHLTPGGDVYKNPNPKIEEAIACAESLARVPQQAIKWGHLTTQETMHDLYAIYYHQVIPSLVESYEQYTKKTFKRNRNKPIYSEGKIAWLLSWFKSNKKHKFHEVR